MWLFLNFVWSREEKWAKLLGRHPQNNCCLWTQGLQNVESSHCQVWCSVRYFLIRPFGTLGGVQQGCKISWCSWYSKGGQEWGFLRGEYVPLGGHFAYWREGHVAVDMLPLYLWFSLSLPVLTHFVTVAVLTHLYVVCRHFTCLMSLFQGHVACLNLSLTGPQEWKRAFLWVEEIVESKGISQVAISRVKMNFNHVNFSWGLNCHKKQFWLKQSTHGPNAISYTGYHNTCL